MTDQSEKIIEQISAQGIVPLFYHNDPSVCAEVVQVLYEEGIRLVEFTHRGPAALANFRHLLAQCDQRWPGLRLAIGTIKGEKEAREYIDAGTDLLICPGCVEEVAIAARESGKLWIPGCMTPTEIIQAEAWGAVFVKLFPGNLLGPGFVSAIKEIFPALRFMPTGGVEIDRQNLEAWFRSGVSAVGMGSKLISRKILEEKDYAALRTYTRKALDLVHSIRQ